MTFPTEKKIKKMGFILRRDSDDEPESIKLIQGIKITTHNRSGFKRNIRSRESLFERERPPLK